MNTSLSPSQISLLPIHDADLVSICISVSNAGEARVTIAIEIDPEESLEHLLSIGIRSRAVTLQFERSWQIISNILNYQPKREQIYDWKASSESAQITSLKERGIASGFPLTQHEFELSGGSKLAVIAENVSICETDEP